jgi:hypothetical protein
MEKLKKKKRTATKRSAVLEELCLSIKKNKKKYRNKEERSHGRIILVRTQANWGQCGKSAGKKKWGVWV